MTDLIQDMYYKVDGKFYKSASGELNVLPCFFLYYKEKMDNGELQLSRLSVNRNQIELCTPQEYPELYF